jgi:trehalose/maltose hydrolase-like predicted phosphorylase
VTAPPTMRSSPEDGHAEAGGLEQRQEDCASALPVVDPPPGWRYDVQGIDPVHERVHAALMTVADGVVGVTGAPLLDVVDVQRVALVAGVFDGEDSSTHLLPAPAVVVRDGTTTAPLRRVLDLSSGVLREDQPVTGGTLTAVRFAPLSSPGALVLRTRGPERPPVPVLHVPDGAVAEEGGNEGARWVRVHGTSGGIAAATRISSDAQNATTDLVVAYVGDPERLPDATVAVSRAARLAARGFDELLAQQQRAWALRWADADVVIRDDPELQRCTRLMLYHLIGSVTDRGEAAVGARGLTGHGYSGHVFWDADTFVLPFFAATHPAAARAMLEYRVRRLPAALAAARARGRAGARFPWESARTGADVTPSWAYDRAGRRIEVRTGLSQEHIVAEVAWAASAYEDWTGDVAFARGDGLQLLVETARWWASRAEVDPDGTAHLRAVIGPDEYHEDVDDDAFTNVMARWNLRRAAVAVESVPPAERAAAPDEVLRWRALAEALVDGFDTSTGRHEQFAGFNDLEPLVIAEVAPRRPIAADVLMGRDRVRATQVIKQPAVLMAHHLVPEELPPGSFEEDLTYYEPRTAHGSSLSPGVHAALLARAGRLGAAQDALEITAHIDTHDLTGTTAAGVHIATAGALWQALVMGFAGCRPRAGRLVIDPHVPTAWGELGARVRFRGSRVVLRCTADDVAVRASAPVPVLVRGRPAIATPTGLRPDDSEGDGS